MIETIKIICLIELIKMVGLVETIGMIGLLFAMVGSTLNNRKMIICFPVWMVSNILFFNIHYDARIYSLMARDLFFMYICVDGYFRWRKKK